MAATVSSRPPSFASIQSVPQSQTDLLETESENLHGSHSNTRKILLETMELVAPVQKVPVPNHLLESKIYNKIRQNLEVEAKPDVIQFGGFEVGKVHFQKLRLTNLSPDVLRMHIIPPQSKFFQIKYVKNKRLVPGLAQECVVEFYPDELRYYYDCIRVNTKSEENLIIPIHAYPVIDVSDFPSEVRFPPVPIGMTREDSFKLSSSIPIDFDFQLTMDPPHPAFNVFPMSGLVPAKGEVEILMTYSPTEFNTAHARIQLLISQFNAKPMFCNLIGSSSPGLARLQTEDLMACDNIVLDPRCISPLDRARRKRNKLKKSSVIKEEPPKEIEKDGIRFNANDVDTVHAIGKVLNQKKGKLRVREIREAVMDNRVANFGSSTRQMKEAMFEKAVRQDIYEERQNQLRWQVKLGTDPLTPTMRQDLLEAREDALCEYKIKRGDPTPEDEYVKYESRSSLRRTVRYSSEIPIERAAFDTYTNDMWAVRHAALSRFQQAGRKIVIRRRAQRNIDGLRGTMLDWGARKYATADTVDQKEKEEEELEDVVEEVIDPCKITMLTFPTYAAPNVKDDMAVDALGEVPCKPTEFIVKRKTPYFDLKVPQHFMLNGYSEHNVHDSSAGYVFPDMIRSFRVGAEDEIISLPLESTIPAHVNEGDLRLEDVTDTAAQNEIVELAPPEALFKPMEYPALHIFNPAPGLQVFQAPLPYAEVDPDYYLCPLPRYANFRHLNPHMGPQKQFMDREDVIKGVMVWKKFPSQGLTSLSSTPTLTSVWVPRWNDPFEDSLIPHAVPPLFDGLSEEDKDSILEDEDRGLAEEPSHLTPEMVNAEFALISGPSPSEERVKQKEELFPFGNKMPATNIPVSSTGPVPREKRERELDFFLKKKYNKLGTKVQDKINQLNSLKTNPTLILK